MAFFVRKKCQCCSLSPSSVGFVFFFFVAFVKIGVPFEELI